VCTPVALVVSLALGPYATWLAPTFHTASASSHRVGGGHWVLRVWRTREQTIRTRISSNSGAAKSRNFKGHNFASIHDVRYACGGLTQV
jgi:hypothetical protein